VRAQRIRAVVVGVLAVLVSFVVFLLPFVFVLLQAAKTPAEALGLQFTLPKEWLLWQNFVDVLSANDGLILRSFINSAVLTVGSVAIAVVLAAMVGYVLQRRQSRWNPVINFFVLAGLIVPPAVVPTIWVLQGLGLFKTMVGMILIEARSASRSASCSSARSWPRSPRTSTRRRCWTVRGRCACSSR
jgi:raffinose/stachyose/melibiose transport system permease protein